MCVVFGIDRIQNVRDFAFLINDKCHTIRDAHDGLRRRQQSTAPNRAKRLPPRAG